jgi:anaerobic magnesium-protoporphyrin IX monomethyl ester cyclase
MVAEVQFIMGLENETPETIEETYRLGLDWKADMVNWNCYTPWPFAELFEDLGDKVEVRDYSKYNFVTPIMKPDAMTREQVLKGVMKNYARFYLRKTFLGYPWIRDKWKRNYMLGCLKAFAKTTWEKKFYDLERLKFNGMSSEWELGFDQSKVLTPEQIQAAKRNRPDLAADINFTGTPAVIGKCSPTNDSQYLQVPSGRGQSETITACGAPNDLQYDEDAVVTACGAPNHLQYDEDAEAVVPAAAPTHPKVPDKAVAAPPR